MTSKNMKMEDDLNFKAVLLVDLTTNTSRTNGFDTIEIDLVLSDQNIGHQYCNYCGTDSGHY